MFFAALLRITIGSRVPTGGEVGFAQSIVFQKVCDLPSARLQFSVEVHGTFFPTRGPRMILQHVEKRVKTVLSRSERTGVDPNSRVRFEWQALRYAITTVWLPARLGYD